jgi:hypothetical protein
VLLVKVGLAILAAGFITAPTFAQILIGTRRWAVEA